MNFYIYYSRAGLGLAKDAKILEEALLLLGHKVIVNEVPLLNKTFTGRFFETLVKILMHCGILFFYRKLQRLLLGKPDIVSIHLEKIFYWRLFSHRKQILIPNQEWFNPRYFPLLYCIDHVWTKTWFAKDIFSEFKSKVDRIGFCSNVDSHYRIEKSANYFFSRVGLSRFRGADKLVEVWRLHPEWPILKLVIDVSCRPESPPQNVEYIDIFSSAEEYTACASSALFHIYATETEGFGHSIVEAMGYGSVVLVTDAPPMNEIANSECALLIGASYSGQKWFSPRFSVEVSALESAVECALQLSAEKIQQLTGNAQLRPTALKQDFYNNLAIAIKKL